ncbi:hypothetical protein C2857_007787 [Epichloe festucae Fl1]|uniref:FAS1 domain-containing protein n=1 Tax=Epichloe festucae (strain Fl1) TaxID=877507 RepID=A0A7S9KMS3_EPIFF|nr:hypothetical protein C2857_007787 [Epichloe festucae Fl1]
MRPSDKQSLPVQPPGQETKTSSDQPPPPPPPPPRIKTLNPSSRTQSSSPPPSSSSSSPPEADRYAPRPQSSISLADAIGPQRSVSSFSSLTRLRSPTATLLSSLAASETAVTVLAPLNRAIDDLPRKPWESPSASDHDHDHDHDHDYDGPSGRDRAGRNLARFVEAHLVVAPSPWEQGTRATTLAGRQIWWEERARDGKRVVLPDEVEVDRVAARVANGELWFLKGVLNHE